jgi:hypothetical protein
MSDWRMDEFNPIAVNPGAMCAAPEVMATAKEAVP